MTKSNSNHRISIIVPTYNEKETIISFLEKVTNQIWKWFDAGIIVVDDGSPDGTAELINDFSKTHPMLLYSTGVKKDWLCLCLWFLYTKAQYLVLWMLIWAMPRCYHLLNRFYITCWYCSGKDMPGGI